MKPATVEQMQLVEDLLDETGGLDPESRAAVIRKAFESPRAAAAIIEMDEEKTRRALRN